MKWQTNAFDRDLWRDGRGEKVLIYCRLFARIISKMMAHCQERKTANYGEVIGTKKLAITARLLAQIDG